MRPARSGPSSGTSKALAKARTSPEFELLLRSLDLPNGAANQAAIRALASEIAGRGWGEFAALLHRHRVTRRAVHALQHAGIAVPEQLAREALESVTRSLRQVAEAHRVQRTLEAQGVRSMMLKGAALSQCLYGDPTMRESKDIDLVVDPENFETALGLIVTQHHYRLAYDPPLGSERMELWMAFNKDTSLVSPDGLEIELHHRLTIVPALLPSLGLDQATCPVAIGPHTFCQFDRYSLFVYLCVHGADGRWHRLTWLADIRAMLAQADAREITDWHADGVRHGVGRCVLAAMMLCREFWDQRLPDPIIAAAAADSKVARIVDNCLTMCLDEEYSPTGPVGPSYARNAVMLRDDRQYHYGLAKSLLVDPKQVGAIALPHALRYLFVPLRLGLWVRRRIARLRR